MHILTNVLERVPWWIYAVLGSLMMLVAVLEFKPLQQTAPEVAAPILESDAELVDLAQFDREMHTDEADSVNLAVQLNLRHIYDLSDYGGRGFLIVLFGATDTAETSVARAAIVTRDWSTLTAKLEENVLGSGVSGALYQLSGAALSEHPQGQVVEVALDVAGLTKTSSFTYIAAFESAGQSSQNTGALLFGRALLAVLGGLVIFFGTRLRRWQSLQSFRRNANYAAYQQNFHTPAE